MVQFGACQRAPKDSHCQDHATFPTHFGLDQSRFEGQGEEIQAVDGVSMNQTFVHHSWCLVMALGPSLVYMLASCMSDPKVILGADDQVVVYSSTGSGSHATCSAERYN